MKKSVFPAALLLIGVGVSGCPVYDDDEGCYDDYDCDYGYLCDHRTGVCFAEAGSDDDDRDTVCREPSDCGPNETCSRFGTCSIGDCHYTTVGCVKGYVCTLEADRYLCVERDSSGGAGGAGSSAGGAGAGGDANLGGQGEPAPSAGANSG